MVIEQLRNARRHEDFHWTQRDPHEKPSTQQRSVDGRKGRPDAGKEENLVENPNYEVRPRRLWGVYTKLKIFNMTNYKKGKIFILIYF